MVIPKLQEGERCIIHVEVGDLPREKQLEYIKSVKETFAKMNLERNDSHQFVIAPMKNGEKSVITNII
jgi:hypothetical protein